MKTITLTLLAAIAFHGTSALALDGLEKQTVKLPFHNKIDNSSTEKVKLEKQMNALFAENNEAQLINKKDKRQDSQMVSDFIDVEVHWGGRHEKLVDRRMNSVAEPIITK